MPNVAMWVQLFPERVKPSFVIFDIRALWRSVLSVRVPGVLKNCKWRHKPVYHRMLGPERQSVRMSKITNDGISRSGTGSYNSCNHTATVDAKGLKSHLNISTARTQIVKLCWLW